MYSFMTGHLLVFFIQDDLGTASYLHILHSWYCVFHGFCSHHAEYNKNN